MRIDISIHRSAVGDRRSAIGGRVRDVLTAAVLALSTGALQAPPLAAQAPANVPLARTLVRADRLLDGIADSARRDQGILIEGDRIVRVGPFADVAASAADAKRIDLGRLTVLPGLVDAHTHVFLTGAPYATQILEHSIPYRTIEAVTAAHAALSYGFTTVRDLETEGAMYADVDVKQAIERGIIPGPRMFVATRALAPTGMYPLAGYSWELEMPAGAQLVDGADNLRHAVREQVKFGADWIKVYADRDAYVGADGKLRSWPNWTDEELAAIVHEATPLGRKVAAHAVGWEGIDAALRAGVQTIEHGDGLTPDLVDRMVRQKVYWCPTIFVGARPLAGRPAMRATLADFKRRAFGMALQRGLADSGLIAFGTDAGGFPWSENPAQELAYYVRYGMTPAQAVATVTRNAAAALGRGDDVGILAPKRYADLVAVEGDPLADATVLERVVFVMKGGLVVRGAGQP